MNDQPRLGDPPDRRGELGAVRHEQREMEEPGRPEGPGRGSRAVQQLDERRAGGGAEPHGVAVAREHPQPGRALVERGHGVQITDVEAHGAEASLRIDDAREDDIGRHPAGS